MLTLFPQGIHNLPTFDLLGLPSVDLRSAAGIQARLRACLNVCTAFSARRGGELWRLRQAQPGVPGVAAGGARRRTRLVRLFLFFAFDL